MKIMIVEDNEALAQTTGWVVESFGHDYCLQYDGKSALEQARKWLPEVVIADIGLPGMDGYELCQHLRAEPALAKTIFIAQSGRSDAEHRDRVAASGFHHNVLKPANIESLQTLLSDIEASL